MAKARTINSSLTRVFDQSSSAIYLLSTDQTILYANRTCAQWLDTDQETLVGTRTVYTSEQLDDSVEELAKGLALAPDLFERFKGEGEQENRVRICSRRDGSLVWREATISPVCVSETGEINLLVVSDSEESAERRVASAKFQFDSQRIHQALEELSASNQERYRLKNLVGESSIIKRVRRQAAAAVESVCDLLIVGPPGAGKEYLARSIFAERTDSDVETESAALIPIHCAIVDPFQIQQTMKELVDERKKRNFSLTTIQSNDTLLLIDVDKLTQAAQLELLGFLEMPGFPLRAIATAENDLSLSMTQRPTSGSQDRQYEEVPSAFFPELAERLGTMVIELGSLKDRREDLPILAQAILEKSNEKRSRQLSGFTKSAMEMICEYDWPRNVDQLTNTIESAIDNATQPEIDVADFPEKFRQSIAASRVGESKEPVIQLDEYLGGIEAELVKRALAFAKGNKTRASKLLGISRPKLLRRLQFFGMMGTQNEDGLLDASVFEEADD